MADISITTAALRVLGTLELLEHILLEVEVRELLLSQIICRRWRDVIKESLPIQRKLFMVPSFEGDVFRPGEVVDIHPPQSALNAIETYNGTTWDPFFVSPFRASSFEVNPSLVEKFKLRAPADGEQLGCHISIEPFTFKKHIAMKEPSASWRRMFLTQPPCNRSVLSSISSESRYEIREAVVNPAGVTMGDVATKAVKILEEKFDMCEGVWWMDWGIDFRPPRPAKEEDDYELNRGIDIYHSQS